MSFDKLKAELDAVAKRIQALMTSANNVSSTIEAAAQELSDLIQSMKSGSRGGGGGGGGGGMQYTSPTTTTQLTTTASKMTTSQIIEQSLKYYPPGYDFATMRGLGPAGEGTGGISYPGQHANFSGPYKTIRGLGPAGPAGPSETTNPIPYGMEWLYKGIPLSNNPATPSNTQAWVDFMVDGQKALNGGWITNDLKTLIEDRAFGRTDSPAEMSRRERGLTDADIRNTDARLAELNRRRS